MIAHPIADLESTIYVSESSVAQFYSLIHHKPYEPFYKDKTAKRRILIANATGVNLFEILLIEFVRC